MIMWEIEEIILTWLNLAILIMPVDVTTSAADKVVVFKIKSILSYLLYYARKVFYFHFKSFIASIKQ